ncbi:hypothetical protein JCM10450v2_005066 [Rhodotorula kratochvilovae]
MAASFNSLPAELVKRIAEMVHDQDSRVPGYPLQRAPHPRRNRPVVDSEDDEDEDEESDPEDDTDVAAGLWSFWHGRGLRALVMVSRRVREAAVPLLYERLAASALAHPFFQFHVLGEPLSQYVQHVVIDNVVPGVHRIPVACALRKLPNLKTLRLLEAAVTRYGTVQAAASIDIFNAGLTSALDVVERLELLGNPSPMETILLRVRNSSNIRSLMLYAASGRFPTSALAALMSAAQRFEGLTEIIIDGVVDEDATANWPTGLSFPALRSLHLSTLENIPAALHFAHVLAPNLERVKPYARFEGLTEIIIDGVVDEDATANWPTGLSFPALRSLHLSTLENIPAALHFAHVLAPNLERVKPYARFEGLTEIIIDGVVDEDATANWPTGLSFPALRSLHLSTLENIPAALHFAHVLAPNLERVKPYARFEGLTEIIIDGVVDEDATANWPTGLSFPALRSLHLSTLENIPAALHFAHVLAPNLERVKVRSIQPPSSPSLVAPHTIFRSLRTLSLDLVGIAPPLLHAFTASPLQHLAVQSRVYFSDSANWPISHNDIVSAPSTLRTVSFTSMFSLSTPVPADFAAACAARGVRLDVQGSSRSGPVDEFFERTTTLDGPRMAEVEEEQADAVEDTLAWAQRRARWLRAVDDGAGMQELAEATRRLRERQVMEAV